MLSLTFHSSGNVCTIKKNQRFLSNLQTGWCEFTYFHKTPSSILFPRPSSIRTGLTGPSITCVYNMSRGRCLKSYTSHIFSATRIPKHKWMLTLLVPFFLLFTRICFSLIKLFFYFCPCLRHYQTYIPLCLHACFC